MVNKNFDNVYKIRIERPSFENNLTKDERKHITETALDNYNDYDYIIENSGTLEELNEKVKKIVSEVL